MSKREFFDPSWEKTNVVLVDAGVLLEAERWIKSCEACTPDTAQMPFDWILDKVTGCDPSVTDYVMAESAKCPRCRGDVTEKTLVDLRDDSGDGAGTDVPQPSVMIKS
jgi:hypothetical protein